MTAVRPPSLENSAHALVLLAAEHTVVLTGEEQHQDVLRRFGVPVRGRPRQVALELRFTPTGRGRPVIEALLDGRRVGTLTPRMSQRYAATVDAVLRGGGRPGCVAGLVAGPRGIEVKLRLPTAADRASTGTPGLGPAPVGPPYPGPPPSGPRYLGPPPTGSAYPRPAPHRPPRPDRPAGRPGGWGRVPLLVGVGVAAVFAALVLAGAGGADTGDGQPESPTPSRTAQTTSPTATTTASPTSATPTPSPTPDPTASSADYPDPATRTRPQTADPAPTIRRPTPTTRSAPPPRRTPTTTRTKERAPGGCDPNYSGCVPIARDVDCKGGTGDGPAYVTGPIRVIGRDIYGLDHDKDGDACE